ncbi:MAG: hypothetical protein V7636_1233 [Actinomycetota bacterium]|jgi:hypothetical protein
MPAHDIDVTIPAQTVLNKDMEISIRSDGRLFGRVRISRGSIDWLPANSPISRRMSWEKFAEVMETDGRKIRPT